MDANNAPFNFFVSHFTYAIGEGQMSNAFGTSVAATFSALAWWP
jgi:hypothetical protein